MKLLLASELSHLRGCRRSGCAPLPDLSIKLHYRRAHSRFGGPCARAHITARLRGEDRPLIRQADFTVNRRAAATVTAPPFQIVAPKRKLGIRHHARVHVLVDFLDGRQLTVAKALPPRCT